MSTAPNDAAKVGGRSPVRVRATRQETRQSILTAAMGVFGEHGIAASSVSDVAAAAGLTKGAVYSSFESKDELVLALMEEHAMHRITASMEMVTASSDPSEVVRSVAQVLVREMRADAAWHRLLAEYFAMAHRDRRIQAALAERRREARDAVGRALEKVVEVLDIELPLPIAELSVLLFALSNGLAVESGIDPTAVPDDLLEKVLGMLVPDAASLLSDAALSTRTEVR